MGVSRQHNRYTTPYGKVEADVIRRAKRYFNYFPFEFIIVKNGDYFFAHSPSLPPFKDPEGARLYKKVDGRWREKVAETLTRELLERSPEEVGE